MTDTDMAFRFTEARIRALAPAPRGKRLRYHDDGQTGLCLRVTDSGTKTFKLYRKVNGKPVDLTLGRWPALTVETARKVAQEQLGSIASGVDVQASKRAIREETTLGELFDDYLSLYAKARKRSWREDEGLWNRYFATLRARRLSAIATGDVQALHGKIGRKNGQGAANRAHSLLRKMFNFARTRGWKGSNPAVCKGRRKIRPVGGVKLGQWGVGAARC